MKLDHFCDAAVTRWCRGVVPSQRARHPELGASISARGSVPWTRLAGGHADGPRRQLRGAGRGDKKPSVAADRILEIWRRSTWNMCHCLAQATHAVRARELEQGSLTGRVLQRPAS